MKIEDQARLPKREILYWKFPCNAVLLLLDVRPFNISPKA